MKVYDKAFIKYKQTMYRYNQYEEQTKLKKWSRKRAAEIESSWRAALIKILYALLSVSGKYLIFQNLRRFSSVRRAEI
jgi:hypothetical protein